MLIQCKPCFAIDVLCALSNRGRSYNSSPAVHRQVADACKGRKILPDAWALSLALMTEYSLTEIEQMGLGQLQQKYPLLMGNSEILHSSIEGVGYALSRLQQSGFEDLYREHCLPYVERWCEALNARLFDLELSGVGRDVQILFCNPSCQIVTVYLSYFSYPASFSLSRSVFVTSGRVGKKFHIVPMLRQVIHELLHGFINKELVSSYLSLCENDPYLKRTRWYLTNCLGALEEEEFVVALEHAIAVKNQIETRHEAEKALAAEYEGCMPVAVLLFDELSCQPIPPEHIDTFLVGFLEKISASSYSPAAKVDEIISGYSSNFEKIWKHDKRILNESTPF